MPANEPSSLTGFSYETETDNLLAVLHAIHSVLMTAMRSLDHMEFEGYTVMGKGTIISQVTDLGDCLSSLPKEPDTIIEPYRSAEDARYHVEMWVSRNYISKKIQGRFDIHGPHNNATTGFVDQLKTRVRNELKRQQESDWTAEPLPIPADADRPPAITQAPPPPPADPHPVPPTAADRPAVTVNNEPHKPTFWTTTRKWLAGIASAVIVGVLVQIATDWVKQPDAPPSPTPTSPSSVGTPATP